MFDLKNKKFSDVKYVPAGSLFPDLSEFAKAAATNQ